MTMIARDDEEKMFPIVEAAFGDWCRYRGFPDPIMEEDANHPLCLVSIDSDSGELLSRLFLVTFNESRSGSMWNRQTSTAFLSDDKCDAILFEHLVYAKAIRELGSLNVAKRLSSPDLPFQSPKTFFTLNTAKCERLSKEASQVAEKILSGGKAGALYERFCLFYQLNGPVISQLLCTAMANEWALRQRRRMPSRWELFIVSSLELVDVPVEEDAPFWGLDSAQMSTLIEQADVIDRFWASIDLAEYIGTAPEDENADEFLARVKGSGLRENLAAAFAGVPLEDVLA